MNREVALLRRYVLNKAAGRSAHPEYARFTVVDDLGIWVLCNQREARESSRWKRLRIPGRPWCPVLGPRIDIAHDIALQARFSTAEDSGWASLEIEVRARPTRCLAQWREAGQRLIELVRASATSPASPGKLAGWPAARGEGARTPIEG